MILVPNDIYLAFRYGILTISGCTGCGPQNAGQIYTGCGPQNAGQILNAILEKIA